eukprot:TRINITY_DN10758_c0_g1::TRINITY_DN10758_c0_g1_i1::g.10388::m.10388 TRINITY_DN10758_c0_g1::TRINITY_DN10758_c0_g1_i1::g.10388  ORF type:complete len:102 (-),score=2.87,FHA/PF00498.21/0.0018 TRINITY_DN10758_c0_g1_i1:10-315(-)
MNGTWVNNETVDRDIPVLLKSGDHIAILKRNGKEPLGVEYVVRFGICHCFSLNRLQKQSSSSSGGSALLRKSVSATSKMFANSEEDMKLITPGLKALHGSV